MGDDIYIHVSSADSENYFSQNKAAAFRIKFNTPFDLRGRWKIGLCEIHLDNVDIIKNRGASSFFVNCSICTGMVVNGIQTRALRSIEATKNCHQVFTRIYYRPVEAMFIDTMEFTITKGGRTLVAFALDEVAGGHADIGKVSLILHLKRHK